MNVLVIGGNGFIGSYVVDLLVKAGHRVRVLDRSPERFRPPLPAVEYLLGDFADHALVAEALTGVDVVCHLLSTTVPATSNLDPVADIQGNLVNTVHLLRLMRQQEVRRLVFLSSGGTVYGVPQSSPITEQHPLNPISSYGIVKVAIEQYLHLERHLYGLDYVVLRASNPYGPRQGHSGVQGVVGTFLWKIAHDMPIEIWGDGGVVRDFLHVADLATICVRAAESDVSGCFNAGSGTGHSINDIVDVIRRATGRDVMPQYRKGRSFDVPHSVLDISAARRMFGWEPGIGLDVGIAETWEWIRSLRG